MGPERVPEVGFAIEVLGWVRYHTGGVCGVEEDGARLGAELEKSQTIGYGCAPIDIRPGGRGDHEADAGVGGLKFAGEEEGVLCFGV